jgi:hypothetical protein
MNSRRGFSLVLVVVIIAMTGTAVTLLARQTGNMMVDADRSYAEACADNLAGSAAAWVEVNGLPERPVHLEIADPQSPDGSVRVFGDPDGGVRAEIAFRKGTVVIRRTIRIGPETP